MSRRVHIDDLRPWIDLRFDRSGGPGGQNVNKVNTRVTLRLDLDNCEALSDTQRRRIRAHLATRISRDGRLRVVSSRARTQTANRVLAEQRLIELLQNALRAPRPRRKTRPTASSRERRLREKRHRGERKRLRRAPAPE